MNRMYQEDKGYRKDKKLQQYQNLRNSDPITDKECSNDKFSNNERNHFVTINLNTSLFRAQIQRCKLTPIWVTCFKTAFNILFCIQCLQIAFMPDAVAQDKVYRWHSQNQYTFSDTPPFPAKAFDFLTVYSKKNHDNSNNTHFVLSSQAQGKNQQTKPKLSKTSQLSQQTFTNSSHCKHIETTLRKLDLEKRFAWDPNTQELMNSKSKLKLRKRLQAKWKAQCHNPVNLKFMEFI